MKNASKPASVEMLGKFTAYESQRADDLARILDGNPILDAYLLNYLANFYIGPLLKTIESRHGLTRPEWIVIFCLTQHVDLNAQQISEVTGRAKSSISHAIKMLEKKGFLQRASDANDGRRQVLKITRTGSAAYADILKLFIDRENDMLACLSDREKHSFRNLMLKMTRNAQHWAQSY